MKNKISIIVTAVTLVALITVGGTLALLTNKAEVTNVVTMGNVNIKLEEPIFSGPDMTTLASDGSYVKRGVIYPGSSFVKDPTVTNIGANPCYIRARVELKMTRDGEVLEGNTVYRSDETKLTVTPEDFFQAKDGWSKGDGGYYYYNTVLPTSGSASKVELFKDNTVRVPKDWGNEIANITFTLSVSAEAIQSDNFKPTLTNGVITGWNYSAEAGGGPVPIKSDIKVK
jgi:SipW-cognate class signal peptide